MKLPYFLIASLGVVSSALAEPLSAPVLERYEQMLLRTPEPGVPFDKVYQHYLETQGLDALASHWSEEAAKGGASASDYQLLEGLLADRRGQSEAALKMLSAAAEPSQSWRPWAALAAVQARAGQLESAVASYKKALALNPPHDAVAKLYRGLALSQQRLMDADGAAETWQAYAKAAPDDPFVLEEAGGALLEVGRFDQARDMFTALRDMKDADPARKLNASLKLAEVEERRGDKKAALAIYRAVLAESGEAGWLQRDVRSRIEKLFRSDDDIPGLVAYYQEQLKARTADLETALRLSDALYELNRNEEALTILQAAAGKAPENKDIQIKLAKALLLAERPGEAEKTLQALAKILPEDPAIAEQLGEAQWQSFKLGKGSRDIAIATWNKLAPEKADANAVQHLAEIFRSHDLTDEAVAAFQRALAMDPSANDRRERLADYLMQVERRDEALKVLDGMVADGRASGETYLRLAKIQRRMGEVAAAQKSLEAAAKFPERAFERNYLSWQLASEAQDWAAAEPLALAMRQSAETDPEIERADDCFVETCRALQKTDAEIKRLLSAREKNPASFTEHDYRILFTLALSSGDEGTLSYALIEGLKQYPKSPMLAKLDLAQARRVRDIERQITDLQLLESLESQRAGDWMAERVRTYRDAQRWDDATALARQIVQQSPAKTETYVQLADTLLAAQRPGDAIKTLQEAIGVSDTPNQVRLRLADVYLSQAQYAEARQVLEDAFEAEETPAGKLQLTNRLAAIYLQEGKLDEFIAKLRDRQKSEQGGAKYALYLAEVYLMMQDSVHAMDELDKALALRPEDPLLLKKLYSLADTSGDTEAALRYARKLAEVEPSKLNRAQLGEALAEDGKLDEAINLIRDNSTEFLDDPSAWQETLRILRGEDKTGDLVTLLEGKLRSTPDDWSSLMTLAELLLSSNQTDKAKDILWQIVSLKPASAASTPSASPSPTPASVSVPMAVNGRMFRSSMANVLMAGGGSIPPAQMRQMKFNDAYQQALQMLSSNPQATRMYRGSRGGFNVAQGGTPTLADAQDRAIVFLACLSIQDGQEADFLDKLSEALKNQSVQDQLTLFNLLQAPEQALKLVRDFIKSGAEDPQTANTALQTLQSIIAQRQNNRGAVVSVSDEELKGMMSKLTEIISASAQPQNAMQRYQMLSALGKRDEAEKVIDEIFKQTDLADPAQVAMALNFAMMRRDYDRALQYHDQLNALRARNGSSRMAGQDFGFAMQLLNTDTHRQKGIDLLAGEFTTPGGNLGGLFSMGGYAGRMSYAWPQMRANLNQIMPVPTRDLGPQQVNMLRSFGFQNPSMRQFLPDIIKRFDALAAERKSPSLQQAAIWLQWYAGQPKEAEAAMKALIQKQPDDDLLLNYAMMLVENKKGPEALKALDSIKARSGNNYEIAARLRFVLALRAGNQEIAREAALKLAALNLVDYELQQLAQEMQRLGLAEEASKLTKKASAASRVPGAKTRQMVEVMRDRVQGNEKDEALTLAYAILGRDPLSRSARDERYQQQEALRVLDKYDQLKPYIAKLKTQLDAAPQSARLNLQLAQALQIKDPRDSVPYYRKLAELRPKDTEWLQQLGNILMQSEQNEEAMRLYDRILAENPSLLFAQGTSFIQPYINAKQLPRLVEALKKAPDPRADLSNNGYQQNYGSIFAEIGRQLEQARPPVDATDIWLKGLRWDQTGSWQTRPMLAQALVKQGRTEEARKVLEEAFFPPGRDESGLQLFVYNRQIRPNGIWSQTNSYGNGEIENAGVRLLHTASSLGLLQDMLPRFERVAPTPEGLDPKLLAHVVARDASVLPQVRQSLDQAKTSKPNGPGNRVNAMAVRILADELASWPEARSLAYEALDAAAQASRASGPDYQSIMGLDLRRADLAMSDGQHEMAKKALVDWMQALKDSRRQNSGLDIMLSLRVARLMAAAGADAELSQLLDMIKDDPNANRGSYYQRMLRQVLNEIAVLQGKGGTITPGLAWLPDGKTGHLIWDLRAASVSNYNNNDQTTWMNDQPLNKLSGNYTLEVYYGEDPSSMKRIFSKPAAAARGSWSGALPSNSGYLRGVLRKGDELLLGPAVAAASGTSLMPASALAELTKVKSGVAKGWSSVPSIPLAWEKGGPDGGGFLSLDGDRQQQGVLAAERIAVDPKKNYVVGGWFRYPQNSGSCMIGWRIYDAQGKEVTNYSGNGDFQGDRWNYAVQRLGRGPNYSRLPDNAAWLEPFVQFNGPCDLQSLFVTEVPASQIEED